jgi:excisionase family DNA binding protein
MQTRTPRDPHAVRDEWLTVDEVCTELKISRRTFDRWRALGTGPKSQRLGGTGPVRVRRSCLDQWLDTPDQDIA